jgi:hypothetical protein
VRCLFCNSEIDDAAKVCPACQRDVAVPASLLTERDKLFDKRDQLKSDLADARTRLAAQPLWRRWFG